MVRPQLLPTLREQLVEPRTLDRQIRAPAVRSIFHADVSEGIRYQPETGKVVYRAPRMHGGKKQNFALFDAVDFLAALADHIPHQRKHEVRYYGAAHPRIRARLFGSTSAGVSVPRAEPEHLAAKAMAKDMDPKITAKTGELTMKLMGPMMNCMDLFVAVRADNPAASASSASPATGR
jgi:hypothetical protein